MRGFSGTLPMGLPAACRVLFLTIVVLFPVESTKLRFLNVQSFLSGKFQTDLKTPKHFSIIHAPPSKCAPP